MHGVQLRQERRRSKLNAQNTGGSRPVISRSSALVLMMVQPKYSKREERITRLPENMIERPFQCCQRLLLVIITDRTVLN